MNSIEEKFFLLVDHKPNLMLEPNSLQSRSIRILVGSSLEVNSWKMLENLIDLGFKVDEEDKDGRTLLMKCIDSDSHSMIMTLVSRFNADVNKGTSLADSPLLYAVKKNKLLAAEVLLSVADGRVDINKIGRDGRTALHVALNEEKYDFLKLLLPKVNVETFPEHRGSSFMELTIEHICKTYERR